MANVLKSNPITVDTTDTTLWAGTKNVRQMQWVGDADDIADASSLVITVAGGAIITIAILDISTYPAPIQWECGPFNPGIPMTDVGVTISHGLLLIWI